MFMRDRGIKISLKVSEEMMVYIINGVESTVYYMGWRE